MNKKIIYLCIFILNTLFMFYIPQFVINLQVGVDNFIGYIIGISMACFSINIFCIKNYIYEKDKNI